MVLSKAADQARARNWPEKKQLDKLGSEWGGELRCSLSSEIQHISKSDYNHLDCSIAIKRVESSLLN